MPAFASSARPAVRPWRSSTTEIFTLAITSSIPKTGWATSWSRLGSLATAAQQRAFGNAKSDSLPQYCRDCEVRFACNGECPKNRFVMTPSGEPGLNYLCAGYKMFFKHIDPYMRFMADELRNRRPPAN